ncbi:hypothetical protein ACVWYN_000105 [Pedobacter sp. UYP24]
MIIQFYADSLGLPRPKIVKASETYIQIFTNWLRTKNEEQIYLYDRAKGGSVITQLFNIYKEDNTYIEEKKDILIIHEGICDCAPRPISPLLRKIIWKLPSFLKNKTIHYIHKNRAKLLSKGNIYYHTSEEEYNKILLNWLSDAIITFEKVILFTIAPTNQKTEVHSPGLSSAINSYNNVIKQAVSQIGSHKISLIDTFSVINSDKNLIDKYITELDGHHLTKEGHRFYANKLIEHFLDV